MYGALKKEIPDDEAKKAALQRRLQQIQDKPVATKQKQDDQLAQLIRNRKKGLNY